MATSTERVRAMRERQRQALEAADAAEVTLRPADDLLGPAIEQRLADPGLEGSAAAAAQLVRQYARVIDRSKDQAWSMRWLGPLLLDALTAINATPMSRSKLPKDTGRREPSALDRLRAARQTGPF
jgi:hypothetical protein